MKKFKPGDLVIRNTGGNKMKIISYNNSHDIECGWITESYHQQSFEEDELIPLSQYKTAILTEKRDDLIDQLLNENKNTE